MRRKSCSRQQRREDAGDEDGVKRSRAANRGHTQAKVTNLTQVQQISADKGALGADWRVGRSLTPVAVISGGSVGSRPR